MRALGADEIKWGALSERATEPHLLKLTIDDLVALDERWNKQDDNHRSTELIDGRIYHTPARYMPRGRVVMDLFAALRGATEKLPNAPRVGMRGSIAMPPYDLPLPDIALTHEPHGDGFIPARSVPLVIEVAESALEFYMGEKLRCYARMGIPRYWVADVRASKMYQMQTPVHGTYTKQQSSDLNPQEHCQGAIEFAAVHDPLRL